LVDLANEAARSNPGTVPIKVELPLVQASQLSRLALHLNRSPAELVVEAIQQFLSAVRPGPR
jgi:hypothetical protein